MNKAVPHLSLLRRHVRAVESRHALRIVGLLPRGSAAHVADDNALDLLGEKLDGLDLLGLSEAEAELSALLDRPVGIVLTSGLSSDESARFSQSVQPL